MLTQPGPALACELCALRAALQLRRIFGTRANELSKAPYFRGFTTCIHGVEVMLLWAVHRHDALRLACNGHS